MATRLYQRDRRNEAKGLSQLPEPKQKALGKKVAGSIRVKLEYTGRGRARGKIKVSFNGNEVRELTVD